MLLSLLSFDPIVLEKKIFIYVADDSDDNYKWDYRWAKNKIICYSYCVPPADSSQYLILWILFYSLNSNFHGFHWFNKTTTSSAQWKA
jgi:hypothetical protein